MTVINDETYGALGGAGPMRSFRLGPRIALGALVMAALVAGLGGWAMTAKLAGAVISPGQVVVDDNLKAVQHRDGGIISEISVREGDVVREGQVILRLDDVQSRAEIAIMTSQMLELTIRKARLVAERDGLAAMSLPTGINQGDPMTADLIAGETRLFVGQRAERDSRKSQLEYGIVQINDEVAGLASQRVSKINEIELVGVELGRTRALVEQDLIEVSRLSPIQREEVRLKGELGNVDASIARAKTRIFEIRLQILSIDETARTEAQRELSTIEAHLQELEERHAAAADQLARAEIRAPIDGTVHELKVHTIGGVVTPAEVLVTIVPMDAHLKIAIRLSPMKVEQIAVGSPARVRFSSFNQRTTPELKGLVTFISPATTGDPVTGENYYLGHVELSPEELAKLGDSPLLPGMPVEVFVQTEERTVATYLAKPIIDQFNRAFRER
jgi:HlyD family type I secretion membrane fusion protein